MPLNLAILSRSVEVHSTERLRDAAHARGHHVDVLNPLSLTLEIDARQSRLYLGGAELPHYDAVIPRIGTSINFYGLAVLRQLQSAGSVSLNDAAAVALAQDKLASMQRLAAAGVPMPATAFAHSPRETDHLLRLVGGAPAIIKLVEGTQGVGVVLGETEKSARSVVEAFRKARIDLMIQHYVGEAQGRDLRVFIVGGEIVAAMERQGADDDFRSNLHRGGTAVPAVLSEAEAREALRAVAAIGLELAGVDILRSDRGPLVIEVNASPGLEGIEATTGMDLASRIIVKCEQLAAAAGGR
ncbi:30S ribosomal protein S6--L-glutamate ligase [Novosphingobium lentum]|uniref:30S ribosomal protein S6--L-glutamate ligase n=1 Tax=Novosphingobium lentum TaxID=145287 RepID=UPI00082A784C|nr:30S ribosomal protein S6--L-glutamate ligase [Novosphingobium lentum]